MKKRLILCCLAMICCANLLAYDFVVKNYLGVNCIRYQVRDNESFYSIAKKFNTRPSTLAIVNEVIDPESITVGQNFYIPLTETNFFQIKGIQSSTFSFEPVRYVVEKEEKLQEVADLFFLTLEKLRHWNEGLASHDVLTGQKILVGWIKLENDEQATPNFIAKEKIIYGNKFEKQEARNNLKYVVPQKAAENFPNYSIPPNNIPTTESWVSAPNQKRRRAANATDKEGKKTTAEKNIERENQANNVQTSNVLTQQEIEFLEKGKKQNANISQDALNETVLKKLTRNSYARDKAKQREAMEQRIAEQRAQKRKEEVRKLALKNRKLATERSRELAQQKAVANKKETAALQEKRKSEEGEIKQQIEKRNENTQENIQQSNTALDVYSTEGENLVAASKETDDLESAEIIKNEKSDDPLYLENKLQRLTLLKSTNGTASFFYAGTAGAKFYVFTNLANKGGIIKITNLNNKKYILAEVIGALPDEDHKRGYIIKVSDNAKLLLQISENHFSSKVNY